MSIFNILLNSIYTGITSSFDFAESIFGKFGISLVLFVGVIIAIPFFIRSFIKPFLH